MKKALNAQVQALPELLTSTGAVAVAVLTVSLQSVRAARSNPVDAIRTE